MGYSNWHRPLRPHQTVGSVSNPGANRGRCGNKEHAESKCEEVVVTSAVDGYDLEFITEDATWVVVFNNIPVISVGNLLSLLIIQIHYNFI